MAANSGAIFRDHSALNRGKRLDQAGVVPGRGQVGIAEVAVHVGEGIADDVEGEVHAAPTTW